MANKHTNVEVRTYFDGTCNAVDLFMDMILMKHRSREQSGVAERRPDPYTEHVVHHTNVPAPGLCW